MDNSSDCTNCEAGAFFITTILVVLIWLLRSYNATQELKVTAARVARAQARVSRRRARAQAEARAPAPSMVTVDRDSYDSKMPPWPYDAPSSLSEVSLILDTDDLVPSREETPIMRRLAPPGHRPTNAQLEGSPFRVAQRLGRLPGQPATPGYETPSGPSASLSQAFSTAPSGLSQDASVPYPILPEGSVLPGDGRSNHFSATDVGHPARFTQEAPVTHEDLQGSTMLDAEGAAMQELETRSGLSEDTGSGPEQGESVDDVVAHWSNISARKNGCAMLREELNQEDFA